MKKLLLIILTLGVTSAYSQEIRVPDEKREQFVKEKEQRPATSTQDQKRIDEAAAKRREAASEQRKEHMAASIKDAPQSSVYYIIQEISVPGKPGKEQVSILMGSEAKPNFDKLDERATQRLKLSMERGDFKTGLDALNHYMGSGWILEHTTVYSVNGQTVREYMIKL